MQSTCRGFIKQAGVMRLSRIQGAIAKGKHGKAHVTGPLFDALDRADKKVHRRAVRRARASGMPREKTALRHTSRARTKRYISSKKIPTVKAHELADFKRDMISDARRMSVENGKGAIVSRSKLMKKHTRRGGRFADMQDSVSKSRTFRAQPISQEGQRVVTFSDAAKKAKKAKPKPKKPKR
jgi:hypothetical protein